MIKHFTKFAFFVALIIHPGCRPQSQSDTKRFEGSKINKDIINPLANININCPDTAMLVFIGSSESMSRIESWQKKSPTLEDMNEKKRKGDVRFQESIEKAHKDLKEALIKDPACSTDLMYVAVIDGPSTNDSKIETIRYRNTDQGWRPSAVKKWQLSSGTLKVSNVAFELDTSRDVDRIVKILTSNQFNAIESKDSLSEGDSIPSQISYVIKAHGGRVATAARFQPNLESLKEQMNNPLTDDEWEPAILADTNGPNGTLRSPAYSPKWDRETLESYLGQMSSNSSNTAGGQDPDGTITSDENDSDDATTGVDFAFSEAIGNNSAASVENRTRFGAYATYVSPHAEGVSTLSLPVPSVNTQGKLHKNLVILDSCYGSEKVKSALKYKGSKAGNNTVILASLSPIYYEFLDYSTLGFAQLIKFPSLLERLKNGSDLTEDEQKLIKDMEDGSLSAPRSGLDNKNNKKLTIWLD